MADHEQKLNAVYLNAKQLCAREHPLRHADHKISGRMHLDLGTIQIHLEELETQQKVVIVRMPEAEGGWILTLIQPPLFIQNCQF